MELNALQNLKWLKKEVDGIKFVIHDLNKHSKSLHSCVHSESMSHNQHVKKTEIDEKISMMTDLFLLKQNVLLMQYEKGECDIEKIGDASIRTLFRYLYLSGLTQTNVAMKMGISVRTLLRQHDEFLNL